MTERATGTFEPTFEPLPTEEWLGRLRVLKTFEGDLTGTARAEMLSFQAGDGSAGYVAIDRVEGELHGRRGTFVLQHSGLMDRGDGTLSVVVVPDSGTGELTGLRGTLEIANDAGAHSYTFTYEL
jgi:hypothetical protein